MASYSHLPARTFAAMLLAIAMAFTPMAMAQDSGGTGYITGTQWQKAKRASKLSYLIGIADLMSAEYTFQKKKGGPLSDRRSAVPRLYRGFSGVTIEQAMAGVDAFYRDNPDEIGQTVIEALWITLVEK